MLPVKNTVNTTLPIIEVDGDMIIFEQGERDETMYLLLEGCVKIYDCCDDKENQISTVKKYGVFGETEMYTHEPRHFSAKTTMNTKLVMIKTLSEFEKLVTTNRWLSGNIMETMSERLLQANKLLVIKKIDELKTTEEILIEKTPDMLTPSRRIIRL